MARITVNPDVASAGARPVWAKGKYTLRIREIKEEVSQGEKTAGQPLLNIEFEPVGEVTDVEGRVLENPGRIWSRILVEPVTTKLGNTISFLRPLIEAAGLAWGGEIDTEELLEKEVIARIKISEYKGDDRNEISGYVKAS